MRSSILRLATLSPLLLHACAPAPVAAPVAAPAPAPAPAPTPVRGSTPVRAWPMPEGCASRLRPEMDRREKDPEPVVIKDASQLRAHVECSPQDKLDYDFSAEWLAMFPFVITSGSFKELSVEDDSTTVTLVVESRHYCVGLPTPPEVTTFFYRVPLGTSRLATKIIPAEQPPCSIHIN